MGQRTTAGGAGLGGAGRAVQGDHRQVPETGQAPTIASIWAPWVAAIISSKSAWTKPTVSGSCCTAVHAASATPSAVCSFNWPRRTCASTWPICRTATWLISEEGSRHFADYVEAVGWAQDFARQNRALMMQAVIGAARQVIRQALRGSTGGSELSPQLRAERSGISARTCWSPARARCRRKRASWGSFPAPWAPKASSSAGWAMRNRSAPAATAPGRTMSRTQAKNTFTVADQIRATAHVECRKDADVIDEIPMAYKDIDTRHGSPARAGGSGAHPAPGGVRKRLGMKGASFCRENNANLPGECRIEVATFSL